jgi:hypothetical protein
MALRFVLDEHLRGVFWNALTRHNGRGAFPLDTVCVGDLDELPLGTTDALLLLWAEKSGRIVVTLDCNTMPQHLNDHLRGGRRSPGVFIVRPGFPVRVVCEFLQIAAAASEPTEWENHATFIP